MRQMFGNLSIRPKMVALLAVPVAGTALLGATGVAGAWGDRVTWAVRGAARGPAVGERLAGIDRALGAGSLRSAARATRGRS